MSVVALAHFLSLSWNWLLDWVRGGGLQVLAEGVVHWVAGLSG
jgi:hypothetical protein